MNLRGSPESWNVLSLKGHNNTGYIYTWPFMPHTFTPDAQGVMQVNHALLTEVNVTSRSPLTIRYQINPDAKWSDGTPITASDFKYTWKVQDPDQCPKCLAAFTSGYEQISEVVSADQGHTVTVEFKSPYQPWRMLFTSLLPAHIGKQQGGSLADQFNNFFSKQPPEWSGGPYLVEKYVPNQSIAYQVNPKWYGDKPGIGEFTLRIINEATATVTAYQNREIQVVSMFASGSAVKTAESIPDTQVDIATRLGSYQMFVQAAGVPLKDRALRRAIATATDAKAVLARTVGAYAPDVKVNGSAISVPGQKIQEAELYENTARSLGVGSGNTDKARKILQAGGYDLRGGVLYGPAGDRVRNLTAVTYSADPIRVKMAQVVQHQLKAIGLTVDIQSVGPNQYSDKINKKAFDILFTGTAYAMQSASAAAYYVTGNSRNWVHYHNAKVDKLIQKAQHTVEPAKAADLLQRADRLILNDGIAVPFFASPSLMLYPKSYDGIVNTAARYGPTTSLSKWRPE